MYGQNEQFLVSAYYERRKKYGLFVYSCLRHEENLCTKSVKMTFSYSFCKTHQLY
jgi:hypothetical protein